MKKLNFAQKVVCASSTTRTDNSMFGAERQRVNAEINQHKIDTNFDIFKKTDSERAELKRAKKSYKALNKAC